LVIAYLDDIQTAVHFFLDVFVVVLVFAELIVRGQVDCFSQSNFDAIRLLLTGHQEEQVRFNRALCPHHPDDSANRNREPKNVNQY
ncbi:hypothetical protein ACQWF5_24800, partial [Salmonella enterica subsp. enterica serovar Infantis]